MPTTKELVKHVADLTVIQKLQKISHQWMAYRESADFEAQDQIDQLAFLAAHKGLLDQLGALVDDLRESMGLERAVSEVTVEQKLAPVIELFDGNRRSRR